MLHRKTLVTAAVTALGACALAAGPAGAATKTLNVIGGGEFNVNESAADTQRFSSDVLAVKSGDTVRVRAKGEAAQQPHTITAVAKKDLPKAFGTFEKSALFGRLITAHGFDPANEEAPPTTPFVLDFAAAPEGAPLAFNGVGDSVFWLGKKGPDLKITAKKGKSVYFLCGVHTWMQSEFRVR